MSTTASKLFSEKSWEILVALITVAFFCGITWLKADESARRANEAANKADQASLDVAEIKKDVQYIREGMDWLKNESAKTRR